jgi:translation initiation factor 1
MKRNDSRLVYSTETGRLCPNCNRPIKKCVCKGKHSKSKIDLKSDGIIRIKRETKGRKGKTVTIISGFDKDDGDLKILAATLKNICGTGGSVKDGVIIIQGDHREVVNTELEKQGFKTKFAGG